jgi:hypothetical protein
METSGIPGCRCGIILSIIKMNIPPPINPAAAGIQQGIPRFFAISMAGANKDQKLAAIIIPAAKPSIPSRTCRLIVLNINTDPAPMAVSAHVKRVAISACTMGCKDENHVIVLAPFSFLNIGYISSNCHVPLNLPRTGQ